MDEVSGAGAVTIPSRRPAPHFGFLESSILERMSPRNAAAAPREREVHAEGSLVAGRFRVQATLGVGGMGAVYRVVDDPTGQPLALKMFGGPAAQADSERHRLRFRREFHTMARLLHPRIVQVFDYGLHDGLPYYTMELLDGSDLGDLGRPDPTAACALLRDVASALAFLHARRLIHRDLAPRNVRCTGDGRAKLIDFGVLATTGFCGDIAGTPPLISPENVRGLPIDHRADVFGLGALAYFLLAGRHAYPARRIEDLEELWRTRPLPPSAFTPKVPAPLDDLVMSMISLDPLGRPGTAAEVIDRLGAIGGLAPAPEVEVARGYLASAGLVGRSVEMDALKRRVAKANRSDGGAVVLEAPSGRGKSRLLRELALEAQVSGATAVSADSESAGRGPYGLLRALSRSLLTAAPNEALEAARPRAPVLARVVPEIRERMGPIAIAPPAGGPEEERMRAQAELAGWFLDVATHRNLVLLVDDVQRSDEASAAVLAALAHAASGRRLLLACAFRTDEAVRATVAVTTLREQSHRVRVRALEAPDVEDLIRGMFGEVPHLARLATWMQKAGGGSPLHCIELAHHLVDRKVIRYVDGVWTVPEEPKLEGMPRKLTEAMEARIRSLSASARALAEALSVHGGELPLSLCVVIADAKSEAEVFGALDELLFEEVLVGSEDSYRFRHDGLREALLRGLPPERRRELHLRVGKTLAGQGTVTPEREAEVGWHLLRGGDRATGADLLARAGARLYEAQSFSDTVAPLEAALEVYEAEQRPPRVVLEVRHMLVMAGCFSERSVALRYADDTIAMLARHSGMGLVVKLTRFLPRIVALAAGIFWAAIGWLLTPPRRRGPAPPAALRMFYVQVAYTAVVRSFSLQLEKVRELSKFVAPVAVFKNRVPEGAYLFTRGVLNMQLGHLETVRQIAGRILWIIQRDRVTPLAESDRQNAMGGAHYMIAMTSVLTQHPRCVEEIARLEALGLRYFEVDAQLCKMVIRRFRGEEDAAIEMEATTDVLLVQAGSMWGPESQMVWLSSLAYGLTRDVLGLRRSIEHLTRYVNEGYELLPFLELARGEYHRERGELPASRDALEHALALVPPDEAFCRPAVLGALSETLLAERKTEAAIDAARQAIEVASNPEVKNGTWRLRGARALGLALAAKGDLDGARRELDRALDDASSLGSPSLSGSLHEARARIAMMELDVAAYALHRNATDSWFRATRNPALIARVERLPTAEEVAPRAPDGGGNTASATAVASPAAQSVMSTFVTDDAVTIATEADATKWVSAMLHGCRGPGERAARALEVLVDAAGAATGYLYLLREGTLDLVAPAYGEEPPDALVEKLREVIESESRHLGATRIELPWQPDAVPGGVAWYAAVLLVRRGDSRRVVGAVALIGSAASARPPSRLVVEQVARELYEAGDVTLGSGATST